jgi:trafficking protein particle complex subunit 5
MDASRRAVQRSIIDRPLSRGRAEVSLSAFSFLFSELVRNCRESIESIAELESKLENVGFDIGQRVLELLIHREKGGRRETRLIGALMFVANTVWPSLFGKKAESLERSTENEDEYMIHDATPITNEFISVPRDMGQFNCAAFVAGIIRGCLEASGFGANVQAVTVGDEEPVKTVFLIKFTAEVMAREAEMEAS